MEHSISVNIDAPPATVWEVMSDVERWHEWTASIRSVRLRGGAPLRVGTRALIRQPRFPPAMWTVTALEPGRTFTWVSRGPFMRVFGDHSVAAAGGGTRATLRLRYEGPIARLIARATRRITLEYIGLEAAGLKRRSEAIAKSNTQL